MPNPDLRGDIADALKIGAGTAGTVVQGTETYIVADNFVVAHVDENQKEHDLVWPMLLHATSGRRFQVIFHEIVSDTPPAPPGIGESTGEPVPAPGFQAPPESAPEPQAPVPGEHPVSVPAPPPQTGPAAQQEEQVERPEPISVPVHAMQPTEPPTNVPPGFEDRVKQRDEQLKPGEPIPAPDDFKLDL